MRLLTAILATLTVITTSLGIAYAAQAPAPVTAVYSASQPPVDRLDPIPADQPIVFRHGDVSWLPALALQAGWTADQIPTVLLVVLRESGSCGNRSGGDLVDKDCNIIGHDGSNHSSDTGLLQINGLNYDET